MNGGSIPGGWRGDPGPMPRVPRPLSATECRVLGSLLEKQQAVPDSYPMTLRLWSPPATRKRTASRCWS